MRYSWGEGENVTAGKSLSLECHAALKTGETVEKVVFKHQSCLKFGEGAGGKIILPLNDNQGDLLLS